MTTSTVGSILEELMVSTRDLVLASRPSVLKRKKNRQQYGSDTHFKVLDTG